MHLLKTQMNRSCWYATSPIGVFWRTTESTILAWSHRSVSTLSTSLVISTRSKWIPSRIREWARISSILSQTRSRPIASSKGSSYKNTYDRLVCQLSAPIRKFKEYGIAYTMSASIMRRAFSCYASRQQIRLVPTTPMLASRVRLLTKACWSS